MNVIFLSIGELTNLDENAIYPDLLRYFREKGHHVFIVCQRERRSGLPTQLKNEHGLEVLRVKTGNITKTNLIEKGISTLLIGIQFRSAINKFFKKVKFDLVLYSTPPVTIVNTVEFLKKRDKSFSYLLLKDIFPQNALDIGVLKKTGWKGILTKYFFAKEKKLYILSDFIGCMSEANAEFIKDNNPYLDKKRIEVCPNTINTCAITQIDKEVLRDKFNLPRDKVIFVCGGNFGRPQDVAFIIDVIKSNEGKSDRHFVFCGSGTDFYKIKDYADNNDSNHLTVMDRLNKEEFDQVLMACDVGLIFLDHRFTIPNFPSRLLDYMNHSMPVFASTDKNTDVGKVIISGKFGWWCESNDVIKYVRVLDEICSNQESIEEMREYSRKYLINNFDTKVAYEKILKAYTKGKIVNN
ncbi:MAG: glycosyltransferase family 4 protein, partial [Mobilitalea sp.]